LTTEIWKDIPGYEGAYQASSLGRIRSLDRYVNCRSGYKRLARGRILRPGQYCKSGHVSVVLKRGTGGKPVHQLVALAFIGPRPEGADIRHLDGDPKNNAVSNLVYGSRTENILDVYRIGKVWRKLSTSDVLEIRELLKDDVRVKDIAGRYGVSPSAIHWIKTGGHFSWLE